MYEITKYLKLPFQFDEQKLVHDLSLIIENKWIAHFNTGGYEGEWKAIPLYASDGNEANIFAVAKDDSSIKETAILKKCHYLKEVLDSFKCPMLSVRILKLSAGAVIKPHRDHELGYEDNNFRLHIPITTNEQVYFILDGMHLKMLPGECWYTNVNYVHSVANKGKSDRVHLVIDGQRNAWSDDLFFSLASPESFRPMPPEEDSPETIKQIIAELKHSNQPTAKELIITLKKKLLL